MSSALTSNLVRKSSNLDDALLNGKVALSCVNHEIFSNQPCTGLEQTSELNTSILKHVFSVVASLDRFSEAAPGRHFEL